MKGLCLAIPITFECLFYFSHGGFLLYLELEEEMPLLILRAQNPTT